MTIQSFGTKETQQFFITGKVKNVGWNSVKSVVKRKLDMLHYSSRLDDLRSPPGNKLKALSGDLNGYYSIRINDQWRIIFKWSEAGPSDVHILDYH